ncbi:MAG TPA: TolC family protein [Gemmatimonadaceae bacterium]|nr:TolC family protein [Gemmatimonadaceae bacterium]
MPPAIRTLLGLFGRLAASAPLWIPAAPLHAQDTAVAVTRAQAVASALGRGARLGVARADTAVAFANVLSARALQNPTLSAIYSKSTPQYHLIMDLPLDYPWLRRTRIGAAAAARTAAQYRYRFERAAIELDADTTYTRTLAARAHAQLSRRNAEAADSLRRMAISRRDAGDASDLDVALATVNAGQAMNAAAVDSLAYLSAVLDLQTIMGLQTGAVALTPSDSLGAPPADSAGLVLASAVPLPVAAARASLESARLAAAVQHRSVWLAPSFTAGVEGGDPTGSEPGILPTIGVALPIPFLSRNRGPILLAEAERTRAEAELTLAQVESQAAIARAQRQRAIALARVERDRTLVTAADRVASMSLTAYREGASAIANVLEAQRNAREVLGQYVDDLADAWNATALLRVITLTPAASAP